MGAILYSILALGLGSFIAGFLRDQKIRLQVVGAGALICFIYGMYSTGDISNGFKVAVASFLFVVFAPYSMGVSISNFAQRKKR